MAKLIPAGEKVFMVSKDTNTTYGGSDALKAMSEWYTMEDITTTVTDVVKPYKVYTALLTQSGGSVWVGQTNGTFSIGVSYNIDTYIAGDDFSNIGGPASGVNGQWDGYWFVATGTTPLNYTNGSLTQWNTGAPVATVLENTIGNIVWSYYGVGEYLGTLNAAFPIDKTFIIIGGPSIGGNNGYCFAGYYNTDGVTVYSASGPTKIVDAGDNILDVTSIEIRVYN